MSVSYECYVLSGRGPETGRSLVQESPKMCVCVCVFVCGQMQQEPSILTWVDEMGSEKEAKKRREKRNKR